MGFLKNGQWVDQWYNTKKTDDRFVRQDPQFRNWITSDDKDGFKAEKGRYHLYISLACPWAHRTSIFRKIKGLDEMISVSIVHWLMGEKGWTFESDEYTTPDLVNGSNFLYQVYIKAKPDYSGRVTVPVLWDKKNNTIVSNESSEIIRMFNSEFDKIGAIPGNYYPKELRSEIDTINLRIYNTVNNGVYKTGFATSQEAYEEAIIPLFDTLNWIENKLSKKRYLLGDKITEADWRLFTTLVRFDSVYVGHFKCNISRIVDYPNLSAYLRDLYQYPGISETVNMKHIKKHYYGSHEKINPSKVVPIGPNIELSLPHRREDLNK
mgnify:FL=1